VTFECSTVLEAVRIDLRWNETTQAMSSPDSAQPHVAQSVTYTDGGERLMHPEAQ
jgi:hypothetical protein